MKSENARCKISLFIKFLIISTIYKFFIFLVDLPVKKLISSNSLLTFLVGFIMRFFFLTLMVAACGGQPPLSSTQCIRSSSLSDEGRLGCLYNPSPVKVLPSLLLPKATAIFSQQQDNGQHCLYEGRMPLSALKRDYVSVRSVHGRSKAITKFSLAAEDVRTALQVVHMTEKLRHVRKTPDKLTANTGAAAAYLLAVAGASVLGVWRGVALANSSSCRSPAFLYRAAGDIFRRGDFAQQIDRLRDLCGDRDAAKIVELAAQNTDEKLTDMLQMAERVFSSNRTVVYYDAWALVNALHPAHTVALVRSFRKKAYGNFKKIRQIKKSLPWVRSEGASICQQQISI